MARANACAAHAASRLRLRPVRIQGPSGAAFNNLLQTIDTMRRVVNPGLEVAGMLISLFNPRRTIAQLYANQLQGQQVHVFTARIKDSSKYREAITSRKPITHVIASPSRSSPTHFATLPMSSRRSMPTTEPRRGRQSARLAAIVQQDVSILTRKRDPETMPTATIERQDVREALKRNRNYGDLPLAMPLVRAQPAAPTKSLQDCQSATTPA